MQNGERERLMLLMHMIKHIINDDRLVGNIELAEKADEVLIDEVLLHKIIFQVCNFDNELLTIIKKIVIIHYENIILI
jgi:hypothetical protein